VAALAIDLVHSISMLYLTFLGTIGKHFTTSALLKKRFLLSTREISITCHGVPELINRQFMSVCPNPMPLEVCTAAWAWLAKDRNNNFLVNECRDKNLSDQEELSVEEWSIYRNGKRKVILVCCCSLNVPLPLALLVDVPPHLIKLLRDGVGCGRWEFSLFIKSKVCHGLYQSHIGERWCL
jgi:hypothetical protein